MKSTEDPVPMDFKKWNQKEKDKSSTHNRYDGYDHTSHF